jgi:hypothetical protein
MPEENTPNIAEATLKKEVDQILTLLEDGHWPPLRAYTFKESSGWSHRFRPFHRPLPTKQNDYDGFFYRQLLNTHTELETEFRSALGNFCEEHGHISYPTASAIARLLKYAKEALDHGDIETACNLLPLVDRYMVWIYTGHALKARSEAVLTRLQSLEKPERERFNTQITNYLKLNCDEDQPEGKDNLVCLRGTLDEALRVCHQADMEKNAGYALQIRRLRAMRNWGVVFLAPLVITAPLLFKPATLNLWSIPASLEAFRPWLIALLIAMLGAVGGLTSGLFQARSTRVSFKEYQENTAKITLKPIAGALVALLLSIFLSWEVISIITVKDAGAFILVAFLAGFSERYFLQVLKLTGGDDNKPETKPTVALSTGS